MILLESTLKWIIIAKQENALLDDPTRRHSRFPVEFVLPSEGCGVYGVSCFDVLRLQAMLEKSKDKEAFIRRLRNMHKVAYFTYDKACFPYQGIHTPETMRKEKAYRNAYKTLFEVLQATYALYDESICFG